MPTHPHKHLLIITGLASVAVAFILILAKAVAWYLSGSVGILASLLDSVVDSLASLLNLLAIRYALIPPDWDHRFGHGKAESLASLGQAAFISLSSVVLIWQGVGRIFTPVPLTAPVVSIGVMLFSILLTGLLILLQRHTLKRTNSEAIGADRLHYTSDFATNVGIIVALIFAEMGFTRFDGIVGVVIGVYILVSAWQMGSKAAQLLLDREISSTVRAEIGAIVARHEQALGFHDLRTRQSGYTQFIQLHVDMDERLPLREAHALADRIEADIRQHYPSADVIIHQDPVTLAPHVAVPRVDAPAPRTDPP